MHSLWSSLDTKASTMDRYICDVRGPSLRARPPYLGVFCCGHHKTTNRRSMHHAAALMSWRYYHIELIQPRYHRRHTPQGPISSLTRAATSRNKNIRRAVFEPSRRLVGWLRNSSEEAGGDIVHRTRDRDVIGCTCIWLDSIPSTH
jgi:hypothetical protein